MFCFVDSFEGVYFEYFFEPELVELNSLIEPVFGAVFALVGGLFADRVGRKRLVIYGFVSLGIAYAIMGLAPFWVGAWYIYSVVDGIAWGIFYVMFILVLWGEIATGYGKERYYAIGGTAFFLSEFVVGFFTPQIKAIPGENAFASFSLAAFFLFLAVLPLMYASETLPEKEIQKREMEKYLEKAKRIREKYG